MTMEQIILLAREAGFQIASASYWGAEIEAIERFASLVAAAEREACAQMCDEARAARLAETIRARGQE